MEEIATDEVGWYCLKSQPKHEHIASAHLQKMADVEVFCPRLRFKRPTKRGPRWFHEAMFPGYLFARFPFISRYREVRYAFGVNTILRFGTRYLPIANEVIEALREKTNEEQVAVIEADYSEGDHVTIAEGALTGLEVVVTQFLTGKERVQVLLNFLGRDVLAEVDKPGVLPAKRHPMAA